MSTETVPTCETCQEANSVVKVAGPNSQNKNRTYWQCPNPDCKEEAKDGSGKMFNKFVGWVDEFVDGVKQEQAPRQPAKKAKPGVAKPTPPRAPSALTVTTPAAKPGAVVTQAAFDAHGSEIKSWFIRLEQKVNDLLQREHKRELAQMSQDDAAVMDDEESASAVPLAAK